MIKIICIMLVMLFISACDDSDAPKEIGKDHIWKEQTDMIDKAKTVEQLVNDAAIEQKQLIDLQVQQ